MEDISYVATVILVVALGAFFLRDTFFGRRDQQIDRHENPAFEDNEENGDADD